MSARLCDVCGGMQGDDPTTRHVHIGKIVVIPGSPLTATEITARNEEAGKELNAQINAKCDQMMNDILAPVVAMWSYTSPWYCFNCGTTLPEKAGAHVCTPPPVRKWDARGYIPARKPNNPLISTAWTDPVGGWPTSPKELDEIREEFRNKVPDGLKAVIYRDLYREGLRISAAEKKAEAYIEELKAKGIV